jgi:hypothetical protein
MGDNSPNLVTLNSAQHVLFHKSLRHFLLGKNVSNVLDGLTHAQNVSQPIFTKVAAQLLQRKKVARIFGTLLLFS